MDQIGPAITEPRRGRPRSLEPHVTVGATVPHRLQLELQAAAAAAGRSLSSEIAYRLDRSLCDEVILARLRASCDWPSTLGYLLDEKTAYRCCQTAMDHR